MERLKRLMALATPVALAIGIILAGPAKAQTPPFTLNNYIGQMKPFAANYCPNNWLQASGQYMDIQSNLVLYAVFGTIYGGDGRTSFRLPDLRGKSPIHNGTGPGLSTYLLGERGGYESVMVRQLQIPTHNHLISVNNTGGDKRRPANDFLSYSTLTDNLPTRQRDMIYATDKSGLGFLRSNSMLSSGGYNAHENRAPFLVVTWCIALTGAYPVPQ